MPILAIDTTTDACSVALRLNSNATMSSFRICPREHTKYILPMVRDILHQGKIQLSEIDTIAFSRGPGSFTGIRVSMSVAQGLALGTQVSIIGISTLATLAQGVLRRCGFTHVLSTVKATMDTIYWSEYHLGSDGIWLGEETESLINAETACKRLLSKQQDASIWYTAGTGWQLLCQEVDQQCSVKRSAVMYPSAEDMLPLTLQNLERRHNNATLSCVCDKNIWEKMSHRGW
jgi:tRNA threonylcarbamoyladenosine biosynthesis protein TsaB